MSSVHCSAIFPTLSPVQRVRVEASPMLANTRPCVRVRQLGSTRRGRCASAPERISGWPTPYRDETARIVDALLYRQAAKTLLSYLYESNGEGHHFLSAWLSSHGPPPVDGLHSAKAWCALLAAQPLATVADPRVGSGATRLVSPRDLVERMLDVRLSLAAELGEDLGRTRASNADVLRDALARTQAPPPPPSA